MQEKIFSLARELAEAIRQCEQYRVYEEAVGELLGAGEPAEVLSAFRAEVAKLHMREMLGESVDSDMAELDAYFVDLLQDERIAAYLQAEQDFGNIMVEVQNILTEDISMWDGEPPFMEDGEAESGMLN